MSAKESLNLLEKYFSIYPIKNIKKNFEVFDMGCGSGRWANIIASKVKLLHCVEPSKAINIAKKNLSNYDNVIFHQTSVEDPGIKKDSQDFGYSLGVLHHLPDTEGAIKSCVELLKPGAPLLLYLYYAFDNRPLWYRIIWNFSNRIRKIISKMPSFLKFFLSDVIAFLVYYPLARLCYVLKKININVENIPLSYYQNLSFYTMRTDSRDRFGTPLEKRFTKKQIITMMKNSGLEEIKFSSSSPYWCVLGYKKN